MNTIIFENGVLHLNGNCINVNELPWNEHQTFKGVFLKHLIKGETTGNQLSCHLVRVEPGCEIGTHIHAGKTELHEIISGSGKCIIEQQTLEYQEGVMGYIPAYANHSVKAGNEGLFLLAKFFPALL